MRDVSFTPISRRTVGLSKDHPRLRLLREALTHSKPFHLNLMLLRKQGTILLRKLSLRLLTLKKTNWIFYLLCVVKHSPIPSISLRMRHLQKGNSTKTFNWHKIHLLQAYSSALAVFLSSLFWCSSPSCCEPVVVFQPPKVVGSLQDFDQLECWNVRNARSQSSNMN